jgi:chromosomal replication initiator protein
LQSGFALISGLFSLPLASADAAAGPRSNRVAGGIDAFIAGPENVLVRTVAQAAVADPVAFNPLVLCGPAGVGKTSLAHSLAARRRVRVGLKHVIATSGADLARGLAHAIETDSVADFRSRYHRCDLLLIDDLQQIAGKPAAQEFLLAALEALLRRGSLVIATLRRLPSATDGLPPMLSSRMSSGLVVPLAPPGLLARKELVRQAGARVSQPLDDAVIEQLAAGPLASRLTTAAKLRNAVFELSVAAEAQRRAIRPIHVTRWLAQNSPEAKTVCRQVISLVCQHAGLTAGDLKGKSREQAVTDARGLAMYLVRQVSGTSYAEIGRFFGGRDHTTVLHACRKLAALIARDETTRRAVDELATQLAAAADG